MKRWSGTSRRLLFAFAPLVLFIAAASYFALAGLWQIHAALHAISRQEEAIRSALELASAVRDQYAHQAHTIIIGNESHLEMYRDAQERVLMLTGEVRRQTQTSEQRAWVDDIERSSTELDSIFRDQIVPAVLRGQASVVKDEHARAQLVVSSIQERADQLTNSFERAIADFKTRADAIERRVLLWTVILLGTSIAFAIGVGLYIRRSVAHPIAKLEAGAARIASGDLATVIRIDSQDEFGRLAAEFNAMTRALTEHQTQLVQSEKLAGIGRLAAGVAHEINNPLGVILGYVRLMRRQATGNLADELAIIEEEAMRCQVIVEGLLDLSRPHTQSSTVVSLRELCEDIVTRLKDARVLTNVHVTTEGDALATGNPEALRQAMTNLIKNAIEAAGANGSVQIRAGASSGQIRVSVADSGPGIAGDVEDRLFEPFTTTKPRGTGLGLAVSQAIARAHGGSIEVGRAALGGALFTLSLPSSAQGTV